MPGPKAPAADVTTADPACHDRRSVAINSRLRFRRARKHSGNASQQQSGAERPGAALCALAVDFPDILVPYFPRTPPVTPAWVTYPGLYSATCSTAGGATWLQVNDLTVAGRPAVGEPLGAAWGYHLVDINLALGNLVDDVAAEEAAYTGQH